MMPIPGRCTGAPANTILLRPGESPADQTFVGFQPYVRTLTLLPVVKAVCFMADVVVPDFVMRKSIRRS